MSEIVLLGSVFLPATTFGPLAQSLTERRHDVRIASVEGVATADHALAAYRAVLDGASGAIAVAHSNAGAYLPALTATVPLAAAVFMDAVLPDAAGGALPVVRPDLADLLRPLVVDGRLPRWTDWWPRQDAVALFRDEQDFDDVQAATPRVASDYLDTAVEVPAAWTAGLTGAYLAFGDTYAEERRRAEQLGWPTRTMPLGHLGHLRQPADVAQVLLDLVDRVTIGR